MLTEEMMRENWSRQVPGETMAASIQMPRDAHGELYRVGRKNLGSWKRTLEERLRASWGQGSECLRITTQTILGGPDLGAPLGSGL